MPWIIEIDHFGEGPEGNQSKCSRNDGANSNPSLYGKRRNILSADYDRDDFFSYITDNLEEKLFDMVREINGGQNDDSK